MLTPIAKLLDGLTMYNVVIYGLSILAVISVGISFTPYAIFSAPVLLMQFGVVIVLGLGVNTFLAKLFKAPLNHEPALVTSLILFFLINPDTDFSTKHIIVLCIAVLAAMLSKYVIAWKKRHVFNPAAFGAVVLGLLGIFEPTWWIGSTPLFIPMLIVGLLITWKIRRFDTVIPFFIVGFILFFIQGLQFDDSLLIFKVEATKQFISFLQYFQTKFEA